MSAQKKVKLNEHLHSWTSGCKCLSKGWEHFELNLNKSQLLVGKSQQADLVIDHASIAFYHALFLVSEDKVEILDLTPGHQLIVNGKQVSRYCLQSGDKFKIGTLDFIFENPELAINFEERNPKLHKFAPMTPPTLKVLPTTENSQHILIDGDICHLKLLSDITLDKDIKDLLSVEDIITHYVETEERQVTSFYPEKIKNEEEVIIVSYFCAHQLVAMDTFSSKMLENHSIDQQHLSPELAQWWVNKDKVISKDTSGFYFHCPTSFHPKEDKILLNENLSTLTFGLHQITLQKRVLRKDAKFFTWWRDRESFFRTVGFFFAFLIPLSVLLLVDVPEFKEPEKEKVVIYTTEVIEESPEPQVAASGAVEMKTDQNTKVQQSEVIDVIKGQPKEQLTENKNQAEEKSEPEKPKPAEQVASKFASLFSKSKLTVDDKKFEESQNNNSTSEAQRKALSGSSASGKAKTVGGGQVKGLAVDAGLSGKKGFKDGKGVGKGSFDAGFTATKTVVLGSIDPELLRKLLREYIPQFRYCYQGELIKNSSLSGTINLKFSLNGKGKVINSHVLSKGGEFSAKGLKCMDGVLKMIPFPSPKGGGQVDVSQPLNFSAEKTKI